MNTTYPPMKCRYCKTPLHISFCNLGNTPLANSYLKSSEVGEKEPSYPLHAYVCENCLLVQLDEFESPDKIFSDYAYFSSYSETFLKHAKNYVDRIVKQFYLTPNHFVVEIASNDGYLLQFFKHYAIPVLGIEPAENVAKVAEAKGIPTLTKFFGTKTAEEVVQKQGQADLIVGNNVLAHVPNLLDFVLGLKILLKPQGIITLEFPHLLQLMEKNQFDTIYHEHFSYFSFLTVEKIFADLGLTLFDVEELPIHGGSLRIFAKHKENAALPISDNVFRLKELEKSKGLDSLITYLSFEKKAANVKTSLIDFLIQVKKEHKKLIGYGAPAKGNTLLNYCAIHTDLIACTVDKSPHKQGLFLPGSKIPIQSPEIIKELKPDYVLILPWNLKEEIMEQLSFIRSWGGKFVVPIPELEVCP